MNKEAFEKASNITEGIKFLNKMLEDSEGFLQDIRIRAWQTAEEFRLILCESDGPESRKITITCRGAISVITSEISEIKSEIKSETKKLEQIFKEL